MSRRSRLTADIWNSRPKSYKQEISRRMRQIRNGTLKGAYVDDAARLHALGLTAPDDITFVDDLTVDED